MATDTQRHGSPRRLILVAYHFPPAGGGGAQRPLRWVRSLPAYGWEPVVVTRAPRGQAGPVGIRDESLAHRLPPRLALRHVATSPLAGLGDEGLRWLPGLTATLPDLIRSTGARVVLLTGSPFFPFLAGPLVLEPQGVPYVLDFRDPWATCPWWPQPDNLKGRLKAGAESLAEAACVRRASLCLFAQPGVVARYVERYPHLGQGRARYLPNGFDPDDFPEADGAPPPTRQQETGGRPLLVHTGSWVSDRPPTLILDALRILQARHDGTCPLEARFVGHHYLPDSPPPLGSLSSSVSFRDYIPHQACVELLRGADILWLDCGPHREFLPGKLFEYLAAGRPVVAAAHPEGPVARILRDAGTGWIVPREPGAVARGLEQVLRRIEAGTVPAPRREVVSRYAGPRQTERLAGLLDELAGEGSVPRYPGPE